MPLIDGRAWSIKEIDLYTWERLVADVEGSPKVRFKERWQQHGCHYQDYTVFSYACVSSAIVLKTESSKQR
jgi:hypothetical protein